LGDQATSQQYIDILKLNYPNLVKSNGEVNLRAARKEGSWVNRATLGLLGRESKTVQVKDEANSDTEQRSLTNRLSFGLFDKPETEQAAPAQPVINVNLENNNTNQQKQSSGGGTNTIIKEKTTVVEKAAPAAPAEKKEEPKKKDETDSPW
jgi:outer membrane protein assembly factor BamD